MYIANLNKTQINKIINLYIKQNFSPRKIEKMFNISRPSIIKILKNNNIPIRKGKQRSFFNESYFEKINTEGKAYLLGFLLADGCIYQPHDSQLSLYLQIQNKDVKILKFLKKETKTLKKITFLKTRSMCKLSLTSNKLCKDLIKLNITPHKTFTASFPPENLIPDNLIRHFIRGLFDGDGCVYIYKGKYKNKIRFDICGTLEVCESIKKYLCHIVKENNKKNIYKQGKIYRIVYSQQESLKKIYNYLYKDSTIFLERKQRKFKKIFEC